MTLEAELREMAKRHVLAEIRFVEAAADCMVIDIRESEFHPPVRVTVRGNEITMEGPR